MVTSFGVGRWQPKKPPATFGRDRNPAACRLRTPAFLLPSDCLPALYNNRLHSLGLEPIPFICRFSPLSQIPRIHNCNVTNSSIDVSVRQDRIHHLPSPANEAPPALALQCSKHSALFKALANLPHDLYPVNPSKSRACKRSSISKDKECFKPAFEWIICPSIGTLR